MLEFENNFQKKYLVLSFKETFTIRTPKDVMTLRENWLQGLNSWHSPYKAVVDCTNLIIAPEPNNEEKIVKALDRMFKLLSGLFLKKAVGFGFEKDKGHNLIPFDVTTSKQEAFEKCGIRFKDSKKSDLDFRSSIQIQNHFNQHVMEVTFANKAVMDDLKKFGMLKSKITNNLMQWHSAWNLLIDVTELEMSEELAPHFERMVNYFQGLFLKKVIGYGPSKSPFPFKVYRSRHRAAADLEASGHFSADEVRCRSGKPNE